MLLRSWLTGLSHQTTTLIGKLQWNRGMRRRPAPARPNVEALESRCLLTTTSIDLGNLGAAGLTFVGIDYGDQSGEPVHNAGDVNGDGFDDFIIGASGGDSGSNNKKDAGEAYIVFGKANWSAGTTVDLSTLNGTAGFTLLGGDAYDRAAFAVSSAGDVNGDGFDDILVGAFLADGTGNAKNNSGESYVVFGKADWSATPTVNLGTLNGTNGFTLLGANSDDRSGSAVSNAGDVNGDGFDDILIGAYGGDGAGNAKTMAGDSYLVFGKANWSSTPTVDLGTLNGTNGVTFYGADEYDQSGFVLSSAGDVNGDGFSDIVIGASFADGPGNNRDGAGDSYVIFGKSNWSGTPSVDLGQLNGTNGFTLFGVDAYDQSGRAVSSAGDVNGDGFGDLLIGGILGDGSGNLKNASGESYVVFGKSSWAATPTLDLGTLDGTNGVTFFGADINDLSGTAVSGLGDVNGDGFDDVLVSAIFGAAAGNAKFAAGESYVVFGKANWAATPTLSMGGLDGTNGLTLFGANAYESAGRSVSSAGDVNGDGFADFVIGSGRGGAGDPDLGTAGASYLIFGSNFTNSATQVGTTAGETLTGSAAVDKLVGGNGNDTLVANGGADVLYGGQGDDVLAISDLSFARIDGGNGFDTLRLDGEGIELDLTNLANSRLTSIEMIDTRGSGANSLTLNLLEVLNLTRNSNSAHQANTLRVRREANDAVMMGGGWTAGALVILDGVQYQAYTQGAATLYLEEVGNAVPIVTLSINNSTIPETGGTATVTATLSKVSDEDVTINLGFSGTAQFPADYTRSATQIVIPAGSLTGTITLSASPDESAEPNETITVDITTITNGLENGVQRVTTQIVDDDNQAPVFTSSATPSVPENTTAVMTVVATDGDAGQSVTFSITGGADQAFFSITPGGVLTFKSARDFEAPADSDANNTYVVQVTANDGSGGATNQTITVTVTDADETVLLQVGGPAVTWAKKQAPITVLPLVTASGTSSLAGGSLTITVNAVATSKKTFDKFEFPSTSVLGTATTNIGDGVFTVNIVLGANVTAADIQTFLRNIKFSTTGKGLKQATRTLGITLTNAAGQPSTITQTINVLKKAPK